MPTAEENSPPYSEADDYGHFLTALFGLIDEAELAGYSSEAVELLRSARDKFWDESRDRHPGLWERDRQT